MLTFGPVTFLLPQFLCENFQMVSLRSRPTSMQTFLLYIKNKPQYFLVKHFMPEKPDVMVCVEHLIKQVFKCTLICTLFCQQNLTEPCRYTKEKRIFVIISSRISSCVKNRNDRKFFLLYTCLFLL